MERVRQSPNATGSFIRQPMVEKVKIWASRFVQAEGFRLRNQSGLTPAASDRGASALILGSLLLVSEVRRGMILLLLAMPEAARHQTSLFTRLQATPLFMVLIIIILEL